MVCDTNIKGDLCINGKEIGYYNDKIYVFCLLR